MTPTQAIRIIRRSIQGLPDHPWIPGTEFEDGQLMRAVDTLDAHVKHTKERR